MPVRMKSVTSAPRKVAVLSESLELGTELSKTPNRCFRIVFESKQKVPVSLELDDCDARKEMSLYSACASTNAGLAHSKP